MTYRDPAKRNAWQRAEGRNKRYMRRHIEKIGVDEYRRRARERYRAKHPEARPRQKSRKDRDLAAWRAWRWQRRLLAVAALGGCCEDCGIDDPVVLQFDHRVPVGSKRRRGLKGKAASHRTVCEVLTLESPATEFSLLCANCHVRKTRSNGDYVAKPDGTRAESTRKPQLLLFGDDHNESQTRAVPSAVPFTPANRVPATPGSRRVGDV